MSFATDAERVEIKKFIKKALQRLCEQDRDLPQVVSLCSLLEKGIGFHHAGMLTLLKEMVEILFSDGLLKVVFATSTFAIGLNMPAKAVVFTQSVKFNGEKMETLPSSEYLQMAGRAGRRGKDEKGASIICIDEDFGKIPHTDEYEEMFDSKGNKLESKLRMKYQTNLNVICQEGQEIDSLIKNSFFSNATEQQKINAFKNKKLLEPKIQEMEANQCAVCSNTIQEYFTLFKGVQKLNVEISL